MQIEYIKLCDLQEYKNNPRNNEKAIEAVAESIASFGFKVPIVADENKVIIAGHTRYKAAELLGLQEVPCIIASDLTPEKIKAYRLADNKTAELAEWDFEKLEKELAELTAFDIDMAAFGFDESLFDFEINNTQEDDFNIEEELQEIEEPYIKHGEIWKLGNHRLICGDSTEARAIKALLNGDKVDLLLTDPPYNVAYESSNGLTIANDNMGDTAFYEFLKAAFTNADKVMHEGAAFYIWHADSEGLNFRSACKYTGWKVRQCLIWNKNALVMGRQDYQWKHEPCLYGWKDGAAHYFKDSRAETTVIEDKPNINKMSKAELKEYVKELLHNTPAVTVIEEDKPIKNAEHPTMKPVKLMGYLISNSSRKEDKVLDLFGGSGSTLIACEQLNRTCYMCELDPKYCEVIIKRWEKMTGQKAELITNALAASLVG